MLKRLIIPVIVCMLAPPFVVGAEDRAGGLISFLDAYCRTYESKDIDKFFSFFAPNATENNKPFHELLPKYRKNMEIVESFTYRIKLLSYRVQDETGNVKIKGKYFTQYLLHGGTWKKKSGNISVMLVESGDSYLVKHLNYGDTTKVDKKSPAIEKKPEIVFDKSDYYVALGDSITKGVGDDNPFDNYSLDGRIKGHGYLPILSDMLTHSKGHPVFIANEGRSGETSAGGAYRIQNVINDHPEAQYFLIQYGTNDSGGLIPLENDVRLLLDMQKNFHHKNKESRPSGLGLNPGDPGYIGSFKDNMQQIIDAILAAGKIPILAKVPVVIDHCSHLDKTPRNLLIQEYNQVIERLVSKNGIIFTPPDFYNYFKKNKEQFHDRIHPNGKGYQSMATLWFNALHQNKSQRKFSNKKKKSQKDASACAESNTHISGKRAKNKTAGNIGSGAENQEIIFKVQILSSKTSLATNSPQFKGLENICEYQHNDWCGYTIGEKRDLTSAIALQSEMRNRGFSDAFVVAFQNGKRIPFNVALDKYKMHGKLLD